MKKERKHPPRKGPNAMCGGHQDRLMPTIYVPNVKRKEKRDRPVPESRSIAEVWGNGAFGEMSERRARWQLWEKRKDKQREKSKLKQRS